MRLRFIFLLFLINSKLFAIDGFVNAFNEVFTFTLNPALFRLSSTNFGIQPNNLFDIQNFYNQSRLITLAFDVNIIGFNFYADLDLMQHFYAFKNNRSFSNLPIENFGFDPVYSKIPLQAYMEFISDLFQISLGRRRWHLGAGDYSLVAGRDTPYFDGLWVGFTPQLNYSRFHFYFMAAIDNPVAIGKFLNWNREATHESERYNPSHWFNLTQESRYFFIHQIAFSTDTWRIGLTESFIWSGQPANFFIANPFFIWHNLFDNEGGNVALTLSYEQLLPSRNIRIYAELSMDDLQMAWEPVYSPPNKLAFYIGLDWQVFDSGERFAAPIFNPFERTMFIDNFAFNGSFVVSFQALWASRFMWGRGLGEPLGRFTMFKDIYMRGDLHGAASGGVLKHFLAFPYGGDNIYFKASGSWQATQQWLKGSIGLLLQGHEAARISGYYNSINYQPQGVWEWNEDTARNWVFSGVANFILIINAQAHYALSYFASAYISLNSQLVLNRIASSAFRFEIGAFLRF